MPKAAPKSKSKAKKLTDAQRHKRFVETAEKLGADKDKTALDRALKKITAPPRSKG